MTLYVVEVGKNTLITHDGEVQLGLFHMSINQFLQKSNVEYIKTYWLPDTFSHRYNEYQSILTKI